MVPRDTLALGIRATAVANTANQNPAPRYALGSVSTVNPAGRSPVHSAQRGSYRPKDAAQRMHSPVVIRKTSTTNLPVV
jgi:hypothetical protein